MIKTTLIPVILLCICPDLFSQKLTEDFEITLPDQKVAQSLYNEMSYLDSRLDTTNMGIVQLGAFNRKAQVIPKKHFSLQLTNVLQSLTDSPALEGKLLFQLRQFNFAEITGAVSEKGYCYLRAELYAKTNDHYQKISTIDTVLFIKTIDVTRALFRKASKTISDFISGNLGKKPEADAIAYTMDDLKNMENIEKRGIPLYNASALSDGIYLTYASFATQSPDHQAIVEIKKDKITRVRMQDADGKPQKIKAKEIYAIVHNGKPYVSTVYGYYALTKKDNDFIFIGRSKISPNTGDVLAASFFFGILGGLMATNTTATFEMKIDHLSGGFIHIREK